MEAIHPAGGQLIGILPAARFAAVTTRLAPGQSLLLYTDGLTEARTRSGHMLTEDDLTAYLTGLSPTNADGLIAALTDLLADMGGGPSDDTALLALTVPAATATRQESR